MDDALEMKVRGGYASIFSEDKADEVQSSLFPKLDETAEFDLSEELDEAIEYMQNYRRSDGHLGLRLRNYDDINTRDDKVNLAQLIKAFWESRSFDPDSPDTVIIVSGTDSLSQYEPDLGMRVYHHPE